MKKHTKRWIALTLVAALAVPTAVPTWATVEETTVDSESDLVVEDVTQLIQEETLQTEEDSSKEDVQELEDVSEYPITEEISSEEDSEDLDYVLGRPMTEEEKQEQLAPIENLSEIPEEEMETEALETLEEKVRASSYPSVYDLREYATPVKNQISETCWSFATIAAGETNLIMNDSRYTPQNLDLDEMHLAYHSFCPNLSDPLNNITGDYNYFLDYDWSNYSDIGGSPIIAAMTLSQWKGAAAQGTEPEESNAFNSNESILTGFASNISKSTQSNVKLALQKYGPLVLTYNMKETYYNSETAAYFYPGSIGSVNHAVTIVGWDDNYSKENFLFSSKIEEDGAWIVKNSWGDTWGDQGYFYLSYEDAVFNAGSSSGSLIACELRSADTYDHNYQYDGTANSYNFRTLSRGDSVASVYQVKGNPDGRELLRAVGFYFYNVQREVRVQIYKNLKDKGNPSSGILAYDSAKYGNWQNLFRGYDTYELEEPVILPEGTWYAIVITSTGSQPLNYLVEETTEGSIYGYHADIQPGQSFTRAAGTTDWTDNYNEGYCSRIKGFTVDDDTQEKVESIKLNKTSLKLKKGSTYQLTASIAPADASNQNLKWSSSNPSIVSVDQNGKISLKGYGEATITVAAQDGSGKKASCKVTSCYTITYYLNSGKNACANPSVYYNQAVSLKNPTRKGYLFLGWYTDSKYKTKITSIKKGTKKNYTLYARWKKVSVSQVKNVCVKNSSSRAMTVSYSKLSGVGGYQIVYDTNSKFTTKKWVGRVGLSKTITGLKKGKKYYVKVRAFITDSTGKRIYGPYSSVKTVCIKK